MPTGGTRLNQDDKCDGLASTSIYFRVSGKYRKKRGTNPFKSSIEHLDKYHTTSAVCSKLGVSLSAAHPCNPPCATRDHRRDPQRQTLMPKVHSGASGEGGGWCSPEKQSTTPGSCWWFQLEGPMADLPQPWHAGTEAQPLISCFELLAELALLVCRLRSPLPTSGRITLRQSSDNVTAGGAIMKGFTTAHPLRRFVQVLIRWATVSRIKLEADYLPGIDNEWADPLSRNKKSLRVSSRRKSALNFL